MTLADSPDPVASGTNLSYAATVTNAGPNAASGVEVEIETPAGTSFVSFVPAGWACAIPQSGARTPVTCTRPSLIVGSTVFTLVVKVDPTPPGESSPTRPA